MSLQYSTVQFLILIVVFGTSYHWDNFDHTLSRSNSKHKHVKNVLTTLIERKPRDLLAKNGARRRRENFEKLYLPTKNNVVIEKSLAYGNRVFLQPKYRHHNHPHHQNVQRRHEVST